VGLHGVDLRPAEVALIAVWYGLATGLGELALLLVLKPLRDPSPGFFRMNRHALWMIPTVNLAVFGMAGLLLMAVVWLSPVRARHATRGSLIFLAVWTALLTLGGLHGVSCLVLAAAFTWRVSHRLDPQGPRFRGFVRFSLPVLVTIVAALCGIAYAQNVWAEHRAVAARPPARRGAQNVLLVVLDTVRADHLSLYGYVRATTPNLAGLARSGVRFDQARSTAPWTFPSHASIFTGRWPHELSAGYNRPLDAAHPTLAEFLADRGYATAGFVANTVFCAAETGLSRGFAHYDDHVVSLAGALQVSALGRRVLLPFGRRAVALANDLLGSSTRATGERKDFKDAETINRQFLDWLTEQEDGPFFAFLNYLDAHTPYLLPDGHDYRFGRPARTRAEQRIIGRWWELDKRKIGADEVQLAIDAYDSCIADLDEQLGQLFGELERRGVLRDTIVIVTADHGEHLGEHQLFGHAGSLYDPEVHVPLLIIAPKLLPEDRSIPEPVSLRDLPATVVDLLGYAGASPFTGRSLTRFVGSSPDPSGPILTEINDSAKENANHGCSPAFRGPMKSLLVGHSVYIRHSDGREELYHRDDDPMETHDLALAPEARPEIERLRCQFDDLVGQKAK